jgi:hypothetical protein
MQRCGRRAGDLDPQELSIMMQERAYLRRLALENAERMNDESLPSGIRYAAAVLREDCLELLHQLANSGCDDGDLHGIVDRA